MVDRLGNALTTHLAISRRVSHLKPDCKIAKRPDGTGEGGRYRQYSERRRKLTGWGMNAGEKSKVQLIAGRLGND